MPYYSWSELLKSSKKRKRTFKYAFIIPFKRLFYKLNRAFYYLKCAIFMRYNVVKCKKLPPTWVDRDRLMLYCIFQILEDFLMKEHYGVRPKLEDYVGGENDFPDANNVMLGQYKREMELWSLYDWWQKFEAREEEIRNIKDFKIRWTEEEKFDKETEDNLISLMKIRQSMWT